MIIACTSVFYSNYSAKLKLDSFMSQSFKVGSTRAKSTNHSIYYDHYSNNLPFNAGNFQLEVFLTSNNFSNWDIFIYIFIFAGVVINLFVYLGNCNGLCMIY